MLWWWKELLRGWVSMVISAVIYIMPHRQCYAALWMMASFEQRTSPAPVELEDSSTIARPKWNKTPTKWSADESDFSKHDDWKSAGDQGINQLRAVQDLVWRAFIPWTPRRGKHLQWEALRYSWGCTNGPHEGPHIPQGSHPTASPVLFPFLEVGKLR